MSLRRSSPDGIPRNTDRASRRYPPSASACSGSQGSWKKAMYQLRRSCAMLRSPSRKSAGWGMFRIASERTASGWFIASCQAIAPPQSCPTMCARLSPSVSISPSTSCWSVVVS